MMDVRRYGADQEQYAFQNDPTIISLCFNHTRAKRSENKHGEHGKKHGEESTKQVLGERPGSSISVQNRGVVFVFSSGSEQMSLFMYIAIQRTIIEMNSPSKPQSFLHPLQILQGSNAGPSSNSEPRRDLSCDQREVDVFPWHRPCLRPFACSPDASKRLKYCAANNSNWGIGCVVRGVHYHALTCQFKHP